MTKSFGSKGTRSTLARYPFVAVVIIAMSFSSISLASSSTFPFVGIDYGKVYYDYSKKDNPMIPESFTMHADSATLQFGGKTIFNNRHQLKYYFTFLAQTYAGESYADGSELVYEDIKISVKTTAPGLGFGYSLLMPLSSSSYLGVGPFVNGYGGDIEFCGSEGCESYASGVAELGIELSATISKVVTVYARGYSAGKNWRPGVWSLSGSGAGFAIGVAGNLDIFGGGSSDAVRVY